MTVVVDTSLVLALYDSSDDHHDAAVTWIRDVDDELVTTPLVVAELDHVVGDASQHARLVLSDDFERGAFSVRWWADALFEAIEIARRHPDVGLTDASLVALAGRFRTEMIATFDHRHFRTLTTSAGERFVLLPADAT